MSKWAEPRQAVWSRAPPAPPLGLHPGEKEALCVKPLKPPGVSASAASMTLANKLEETRNTFLKLFPCDAFDIVLNTTAPFYVL